MARKVKTFIYQVYADLEYSTADKLKIALAVSGMIAVIGALLLTIATAGGV